MAPQVSSRTSPTSSGRMRRAVAWLVGVTADNAGDAVYGAVMIGVLFAAEDSRREGYPETVGAAVIVLALYWLTSLYTHTLGMRLRTGEPLSAAIFWRGCVHELPLIEGGLVPLLVLLAAWAAGASVTSGATAAVWTAAATIVVLELTTAWRSRLNMRRLWIQAGAGALMGFAIIALKLVLH